MYYKRLETDRELNATVNEAHRKAAAVRMKAVRMKAAATRQARGSFVHSNPVR